MEGGGWWVVKVAGPMCLCSTRNVFRERMSKVSHCSHVSVAVEVSVSVAVYVSVCT